MGRYVLVRALAALALLLVSSFVVFSLQHVAPGSPETIILGGRPASPRLFAEIRAQYHLDDPFLVQYGRWLNGAVRGDFGDSIALKQSVSSALAGRVVPTLELAAYAAILVMVFGLTAGVVAAVRRNGAADVVISTGTLLASSVSAYISGILLLVVFAADLGWFPVIGIGSGLFDRIYHLTLPAIALALSLIALMARTTRASMIRALDLEAVETVRARGFSERRVVLRHALRSAFVPVLTISGLMLGYLISGTVLIEYTFGINGLGSLLVSAVQSKDYAVVQALTLVFTASFIVLNLLVDVLYGVVDPRARMAVR